MKLCSDTYDYIPHLIIYHLSSLKSTEDHKEHPQLPPKTVHQSPAYSTTFVLQSLQPHPIHTDVAVNTLDGHASLNSGLMSTAGKFPCTNPEAVSSRNETVRKHHEKTDLTIQQTCANPPAVTCPRIKRDTVPGHISGRDAVVRGTS